IGLLVACFAAGIASAQPESRGRRRVGFDAVPGFRVYQPERWGLIAAGIANPMQQPAHVLSAHFFATDVNLQFARQLWVPVWAKRGGWYPLLTPERIEKGLGWPIKSVLIDRSDDREVLLRSAGGTLVEDGILPALPNKEPVTGVLADNDD